LVWAILAVALAPDYGPPNAEGASLFPFAGYLGHLFRNSHNDSQIIALPGF
jgi:hypothetical protein